MTELTHEELEALSDVIMRAESDDEHWPFPVRRLSPFELARAILRAGWTREYSREVIKGD